MNAATEGTVVVPEDALGALVVEVKELSKAAAEMKTSIALVVQQMHESSVKVDQITEDHERRLRRLEAWSYAIPPTILVTAGSVIAAVVAAIK